jgi:NAD(P)-dependent dehydrogenase (short-subunit alcohol dehydrogenase family)
LDLKNVLKRENYYSWSAYGESKLANLLFARELQRRLTAAGAKQPLITTSHPGYTATDLQRWSLFYYANSLIAMSAELGSLTQVGFFFVCGARARGCV